MRTKRLISFVLIALALTSCMKKTTIGRIGGDTRQEAIIPNYSDPATPTPECPATTPGSSGITISIRGVDNAIYRANETSTFIVSASGCKYGYQLSYGSETKRFGTPTDLYGTRFETSFDQTFNQAGSQPVRVLVSVLNQTGQPVRVFPKEMSVTVTQPIDLTCPSTNYTIPRSSFGDFRYSFNVQSNRPAKIVELTSPDPNFIVARPTFSNDLLQSIQGEVTIKNQNGNLNFKIRDANNNQTSCAVIIRRDIYGVHVDFNGDRILDDASLIRLTDGSYQLQISYTQYAGGTQINSIIPAPALLASEFYEWMISGEINGDNRPDLLFFRREGNPAVGKFKMALSRGGTVGGTDLAYDFVNLSGQWQSDRLLDFPPFLDGVSSPVRVIGVLQGQQYASRIENGTISNPEPISFSINVSASPTSVPIGDRTWVSLGVQGYSYCWVEKCTLNSSQQCVGAWDFIGGFTRSDRSSTAGFSVGPINSAIRVAARCYRNDYSIQSSDLLVSATAPVVVVLPNRCLPGEVTGGQVSDVGDYRIHSFTSVGAQSLTVTRNCEVDALVVAGGGGGGTGRAAGGGGAGGVVYQNGFKFPTAGSYTVTVGAGGGANANGGNSSLNSLLVATGGGRGGLGEGGNHQGASGGSGGGAGFKNNCSVGAGTAGQGNAGGCARGGNWIAGGGGGGASAGGGGGAGPGAPANATGGAGGAGRSFDISGSLVNYAGGGGGYGQHSAGAAGVGGGGRGGSDRSGAAAGVANTGGGGGGGGGAGGSGVVILRYRIR